MSAPISGKVYAATASGLGMAGVVSTVINLVPWLQKNIPQSTVPYIVSFLTAAAAAIGGWTAHHRPTKEEVLAVTQDASEILVAYEDAPRNLSSGAYGIPQALPKTNLSSTPPVVTSGGYIPPASPYKVSTKYPYTSEPTDKPGTLESDVDSTK